MKTIKMNERNSNGYTQNQCSNVHALEESILSNVPPTQSDLQISTLKYNSK